MSCRRGVLTVIVCLSAAQALPADKPAPGPAAQRFAQVLVEMKDLVAQLQILQVEHDSADEARQTAIRQEWDALILKGEALDPRLIESAKDAFDEAPNADRNVTDLLVGFLKTAVGAEDVEAAMPIARVLLKDQCEDVQFLNAAGIAAFIANDFDMAIDCFRQANKKRVTIGIETMLDDAIKKDFFPNSKRYQENWAKEAEVRKAEDAAGDLPEVLLKTTKGDIRLVLFENEAPNTVANFISLVDKGFYNGLTFHRVLRFFVAQGGCPKGDGTGGPGYAIPCECYRPDHRKHFRGSLSMAHSGRDTGGSQFFITFIPARHLDGTHTVFGRVVEGFEVLHKLTRRNPIPSETETPLPDADKILEAKVLKRRNHEYVPRKVGE
jgi:cyclophilin family peptidyl-prolyl cis-trans isomerase